MRELFDDVPEQAPLDPQEAVRRHIRTPQRKRVLHAAPVSLMPTVDFRSRSTASRSARRPASRSWCRPARHRGCGRGRSGTRRARASIPRPCQLTPACQQRDRGVIDRVGEVADDAAKFLGSDLLFYRAGHPDTLVAREAEHWDPILFWAADALGAHFVMAEGIMHVGQPEPAIKAARAAFPTDPWSVAALHVVTTLTGSALLALALAHRVARRGPDLGPPPMSTRTGTSRNGASTRRSRAPRRAPGRFQGRRRRPQGAQSGRWLTRALRHRTSLAARSRRLAETSDMAVAINPVLPVRASNEAGSVAPELNLEAGSVVNAQVLQGAVRRSGADRDREPVDRRPDRGAVAAGPEPAACGVAEQ